MLYLHVTTQVPGVYGGQERVLDSLELEFPTVVRQYVGNWNRSLEPLFQSLVWFIKASDLLRRVKF